jgi:hypothetical protein
MGAVICQPGSEGIVGEVERDPVLYLEVDVEAAGN